MGRLFGTDGVRGVAGRDLTARLAMDLSAAATWVLATTGEFSAAARAGRRPVAVVGRDPRASGEFLEAAVVAGLAGSGVDVLRLGVVPTPAVAYLTGALSADLGVMLSASHNPAPDNGIKFFARGGFKLPDPVEDAIERRLTDIAAGEPGPGGGHQAGSANGAAPSGAAASGAAAAVFGRVTDAPGARDRYLEHLIATLDGEDTDSGARPLAGLRVVLDCAHGAAYDIAPQALRRAGAQVVTIGVAPDGLNINEGCGSTHLDTLRAAVVAHGADIGVAHDGDADRCLAVAADGQVVDGDQILAILALEFKAAHRLAGDTVVTTVMSNLGFRHAMRDAGIGIVETAVGDRYVLEAMKAGGYVLGGEQSGHIIMADYASTGDGLLTGLHLLAAMARRGLSLAKLAWVMRRFPQVLVNVVGVDKSLAASSDRVTAAVAAAQAELGEGGRVLIRPSGTEPAVRIMVEAEREDTAQRLARRLADVVRAEAG